MNLYVALILFALIILVYWVIAELFTILFRFTGLPDEKARFQVLSLLTGTGFTTHESEMILSTRRRRRLARVTILFGYVFNLTVVTSFINVVLSLRRIPRVRIAMDRRLERLANRYFGVELGNTVMLMDYIGTSAIAQVSLRQLPETLRDKPLSELDLRQSGLMVLLIEHGGEPEPAVGSSVLRDGDRLTVFGNYTAICRVFRAKERFSDD